MKERLQKYLANLGIGSRRYIEQLIKEQRIQVDGKIAELGVKVDSNSKILIDNKSINTQQKSDSKILIYNKPTGVICTRHDPEGRRTVFSDLPELQQSRWISIGRLDFNTSGLLLFTTDGELANKLMHPSHNIEREYLVRVIGDVNNNKLDKLLSGVIIDDEDNRPAKFKKITPVNHDGDNSNKISKVNNWYKVIITEGRNREVRKLWQAVDCTVNRLIRIRFGKYKLPKDLKQGEYKIIEI